MGSFLKECSESIEVSPNDLMALYCRRCRRTECDLSSGQVDTDPFVARMEAQPERFFNPLQVDPNSSRYEGISKVGFDTLAAPAENWVSHTPSIDVTDGSPEKASPIQTHAVDKALARIAKKPDPEPPVAREPEPEPQVVVAPAPVKPKPARPAMNTPPPRGGIMIGGGPPPTQPVRRVVNPDPWAPPEKVVPVGGTVRMGGGGTPDDR